MKTPEQVDAASKAAISKLLNPFLDSLTTEEFVVFKGMVRKMRTALVKSDDDWAEVSVKS